MSATLLKSGSLVDTSRLNIANYLTGKYLLIQEVFAYSAFIENSFFTEHFKTTASVVCLVVSD